MVLENEALLMSNHKPPLSVVPVNGGDQWDEETSPDTPSAVTNRTLLKSLMRLERSVRHGFRWVAVSIAALALVQFIWMWTRG